MAKFRFHRGSLDDSMATAIVVQNKKELMDKIFEEYRVLPYCPEYPHKIELEGLAIKPYKYDGRIDWDTHIVTMNGAAIGFTDNDLPDD